MDEGRRWRLEAQWRTLHAPLPTTKDERLSPWRARVRIVSAFRLWHLSVQG